MRGAETFERHWRWWLLAMWAAVCGLLIYARWNNINGFVLSDTDDNMRLMQVRAWLGGQSWFDLRQYRLDPPFGANIHWSRLVDLPLAGLILLLKPFMGGAEAEKWAAGLAPLLPLLVAMAAAAVTVRRLVAPRAWALALAFLAVAHATRGMWSPMRIDHHGWQLALLAIAIAGVADRRYARGGALAGIASAASLTIGLEMLIYLALIGAATVLLWVRDPAQSGRLAAYGASLAAGSGIGFLLFTSRANAAPVCDAFSPVWLSAMVAAGGLAVALASLRTTDWRWRIVAAAAAGAAIAAFYALAWPHCLTRLEGVSPELDAMWLSNVREARPIYMQSWQYIANVAMLPAFGALGYFLMLRDHADEPDEWPAWVALGLVAISAAALLLWQTRAAAAAQLLAIPGVTALSWKAGRFFASWLPALAMGLVWPALYFAFSGLAVQQLPGLFAKPASKYMRSVNRANGQCPILAALRPVAQQPQGYVLTFVDLGPRLIAVTHHDAVAGPYHRNGAAILDVMKSFRGTSDHARRVIAKRGIDYVLICPGMSESTIYLKNASNGFYAQLHKGRAPSWLTPVPLPKGSVYRMWRVGD